MCNNIDAPCFSAFILCKELETSSQFKLCEPQALLTPKYIPGVHTFSICFGLSNIKLLKSNNKISVNIIAPNKKNVFSIPKSDINASSNDESDDLMFAFEVKNMDVEVEGRFLVDVTINDDQKMQYPFYVKRVV